MNMVYVASAFAPEERRGSLSWSHHAELAALEPDERRRWLEIAEANHMSVKCLRGELRRQRRSLEAQTGRTSEFSRPDELVCPRCGCHLDPAAAEDSPRRSVHRVTQPEAA